MSSRYDGRGRVVPLRVARQLLEQRDQLVEQLQKARRERDRLLAEKRRTDGECEELERQLLSARGELETLRERCEEIEEASPPEKESKLENEQVESLQRQVARLTDDLERVRRRTGDEINDARREERVRLLAGLGAVLDAVDRALAFAVDEDPWRQGLEAIRGQLLAFLRGEGATVVGEVGDEVDPRIHQTTGTVEAGEVERGKVARVDRVGIVLEDGTVARTAQVAVAR